MTLHALRDCNAWIKVCQCSKQTSKMHLSFGSWIWLQIIRMSWRTYDMYVISFTKTTRTVGRRWFLPGLIMQYLPSRLLCSKHHSCSDKDLSYSLWFVAAGDDKSKKRRGNKVIIISVIIIMFFPRSRDNRDLQVKEQDFLPRFVLFVNFMFVKIRMLF